MILRNPREPIFGQPIENAFVAVDKKTGEQLGQCVLFDESNPVLFPQRPAQFRLYFDGELSALSQLFGAAIARGRALGLQSGAPARIYAECLPEDTLFLDALKPYGFQDNDGLVQMRVKLPSKLQTRLPSGCVLVDDDLSDPLERKFFLERHNRLFHESKNFDWLVELTAQENFRRFLSVSPVGLVGEILVHTQNGAGKIDFLYTSKRFRNMGVAAHMLNVGFSHFARLKMPAVEADIRVRIPFLLRTLEHAGFRQTKLIKRYPGIDLNP